LDEWELYQGGQQLLQKDSVGKDVLKFAIMRRIFGLFFWFHAYIILYFLSIVKKNFLSFSKFFFACRGLQNNEKNRLSFFGQHFFWKFFLFFWDEIGIFFGIGILF
jgi:hypothetical protein